MTVVAEIGVYDFADLNRRLGMMRLEAAERAAIIRCVQQWLAGNAR